MGHERLVRLVRPVNTTDIILAEAPHSGRPPTEKELTDPHLAYHYARLGIKGRWPEAEATIATDPYCAYSYARYVIGGRFPEAEAAIAKDPITAYEYVCHFIKGRWPEGEAAIATDPGAAKLYLEHFPDAKLEWAMKGWLDWLDL
jgi:hypothetical protein